MNRVGVELQFTVKDVLSNKTGIALQNNPPLRQTGQTFLFPPY